MNIATEHAMLAFGQDFAKTLGGRGAIIELVGDVGTGKTTFTRGLAEGLGLTQPITSPSFTISKAYALPRGGQLIHYDFYRLGDPGLMADDLAEAITDPRNIIVIEWGESVRGLLPRQHITIHFTYQNDGTRRVKIQGAPS